MIADSIDARTRDALSAQAPFREAVYRYLAAAFSVPPTRSQVRHLRAAVDAPAFRQCLPDTLCARLRDCLSEAESNADWEPAARRDFMALVKVPGDRYVAPYESVYRDEREVAGRRVRGLLCGPSAIAVRRWYRLAALEIAPEYGDLPDHVAMELAFMAHLCAKEQQFATGEDWPHLRRCWQMEQGFLARHLIAWLPPLRDRVHQRAAQPYLPTVADLAVAVTRLDVRTLQRVLGPALADDLPS